MGYGKKGKKPKKKTLKRKYRKRWMLTKTKLSTGGPRARGLTKPTKKGKKVLAITKKKAMGARGWAKGVDAKGPRVKAERGVLKKKNTIRLLSQDSLKGKQEENMWGSA